MVFIWFQHSTHSTHVKYVRIFLLQNIAANRFTPIPAAFARKHLLNKAGSSSFAAPGKCGFVRSISLVYAAAAWFSRKPLPCGTVKTVPYDTRCSFTNQNRLFRKLLFNQAGAVLCDCPMGFVYTYACHPERKRRVLKATLRIKLKNVV